MSRFAEALKRARTGAVPQPDEDRAGGAIRFFAPGQPAVIAPWDIERDADPPAPVPRRPSVPPPPAPADLPKPLPKHRQGPARFAERDQHLEPALARHLQRADAEQRGGQECAGQVVHAERAAVPPVRRAPRHRTSGCGEAEQPGGPGVASCAKQAAREAERDQRGPERGQDADGLQSGADAERIVPAPRPAH